MEINYYRDANAQSHDESWQSCQFTSETDLTPFRSSELVTLNGQPYLRQHHITYLTGRETCRAHHFAKHLAVQVLSTAPSSKGCKVLWIDTLNGPHISASIFRELAQHAASKEALHYLCLDILGGQRDNHWWLARSIESLIRRLNPQLVVIDDMDHFMPYCGIRVAGEFNRVVRDAINHTDVAFLLIGYNHTGKKACTAGELGKQLFNSSSDIFSLSTVRDVTTVRHISGYDLHVHPSDSQFHFTIGPDNLPHEASQPRKAPASGIDDDTLRHIVDNIIQPDQDITPSDLLTQVRARHAQLKRDTRDAALLDQIHRLHLLTPSGIPSGTPEGRDSGTSHAFNKVQGGSISAPASQPAVRAVRVNGDAIAVKGHSSKAGSLAVPCAAAQQRPPQYHEINTSLTLPLHPQPSVPSVKSAPPVEAPCPVDGGRAAAHLTRRNE